MWKEKLNAICRVPGGRAAAGIAIALFSPDAGDGFNPVWKSSDTFTFEGEKDGEKIRELRGMIERGEIDLSSGRTNDFEIDLADVEMKENAPVDVVAKVINIETFGGRRKVWLWDGTGRMTPGFHVGLGFIFLYYLVVYLDFFFRGVNPGGDGSIVPLIVWKNYIPVPPVGSWGQFRLLRVRCMWFFIRILFFFHGFFLKIIKDFGSFRPKRNQRSHRWRKITFRLLRRSDVLGKVRPKVCKIDHIIDNL